MAFDLLVNRYPSLHVFVWMGVDYALWALIRLSVMYFWLLLFIGDVDMLITSIDSLTYFSIVTLLVVWLSYFPRHVYSHFCISHSSWHDWFYLLYVILFIIFLPSLCVDMSDIPVICMIAWCMIVILLCDACVACLCGTHIYPLTSNSLNSVNLVSLDLVFDMRLVTLFALRPS